MSANSLSLLYVSGYAEVNQAGIHTFMLDETSGQLIPQGSFEGILNPSFIVVHPNGRWLYSVSEKGQDSHGSLGEVWALQFEREPFSIQAINHQTSGGDWPCHLRFDHSAQWLLATNYGTGNAGIYPLQADGSVGEMTDFVQHHGKGPNTARQEGPHAHSSIFTPDNKFVVIADLGIDELVVYQFDSAAGKLIPSSSVKTRAGAGPRHLVFHPNGKWMYAANELDSTVTLYDYDAVKGALIERQSISSIPSDSPENIVADIHMSASGQRLYVSNRGHNSIAVYDVGSDGELTLVSIPSCGGNWPRNFALSKTGKYMLVANQYSNEICVLPILEGAEALGAPVARATIAGASCVQFV